MEDNDEQLCNKDDNLHEKSKIDNSGNNSCVEEMISMGLPVSFGSGKTYAKGTTGTKRRYFMLHNKLVLH